MVEMKSEAMPTSGFKVRPLLRVAKAKPSLVEPQKSEVRDQKPEVREQRSEVNELPSGSAGGKLGRSLSKTNVKRTRLRELTEELRTLEAKLRRGGGPDKIAKQHK